MGCFFQYAICKTSDIAFSIAYQELLVKIWCRKTGLLIYQSLLSNRQLPTHQPAIEWISGRPFPLTSAC
jgi:hypothetical protein